MRPLKTFSPDGTWLVLAGQDNTAVVMKVGSHPFKRVPFIKSLLGRRYARPWGTYYGHQLGLYKIISGILTRGSWVEGDCIITVSSDGKPAQKWHVPSCTHRELTPISLYMHAKELAFH